MMFPRFRLPVRSLLLSAILLAEVGAVAAAVQLASPFGNNMVLQRGKPVPVWGTAAPAEAVSVDFAGQTVATTADANGRWRVELPVLTASATPRDLTVTGTNTVTLTNVLVGEVWLCSGQSNMEWEVEDANDAAVEIAAANYPLIRLATVAQVIGFTPAETVAVTWAECQPATVPKFSAVAYYFARELHQRLGIPVAVMDAAWGGTPVEAWMSLENLQSDPAFSPVFDRWDDSVTKKMSTGLYNGMIHPLFPFALRGVTWYQGEENAPRYDEYRKLFPAMIREWRAKFQQGDIPFYFVQLANMNRSNDPTGMQWAFQREAQMQGLTLPNTGVAVAIDLGEDNNIHPTNKQDVGRRLALNALARDYGVEIEYSGPVFAGLDREGSALRVRFTHATGLHAATQPVPEFEIAGADLQFVAADAVIEGETVRLSAAMIADPRYVRYAWRNNPARSLYNAAGLPASPFRTGVWFGTVASSGGPVRELARDYVTVGESPEPLTVQLFNPAILRLDSGRLLASYTLNGPTAELGLPSQRVLTSDDGGHTWTVRREYFGASRLTQARFFTAGGKIYLLGQYSNVRIAVSADQGETWSDAVELTTGQRWQTTPANVWKKDGHVYLGLEWQDEDIDAWSVSTFAPVIWRAPESADLLQPSSWTQSSRIVFRDIIPGFRENAPELDHFGVPFFTQAYPTSNPVGGTRKFHPMGWLETNVVQVMDPDHTWYDETGRTFHLLMRANTGGTGYAGLLKVVEQPDGSMLSQLEQSPAGRSQLFLPLPGGQMKFHVLYDEQQKLYWLLSSQATDSMIRAELLPADRYALPNEERHRLVLHFSRNLVDWNFAGVVAIGGGTRQARHYACMDFDGDDLVILSRSGDIRAKDAHNGNIITFHRVRNFRALTY